MIEISLTGVSSGSNLLGGKRHKGVTLRQEDVAMEEIDRKIELFVGERDAADPLLGEWISEKYRIDSFLGEGGYGRVYKAFQPGLQRFVAVKLLSPFSCLDKDKQSRFLQEGRFLASFKHPSVCQILDFVEYNGMPALVLEFVEGQSLKELLRDGRYLSVEDAIQLGVSVCEALEAVHAAGLVHRDIKPDNIKVCWKDGEIKATLLDFGISKLLESADDTAQKNSITRTGAIVGTPAYMSPEQCQGRAIDGRSDLYSLGTVIYELVSGKNPFEADSTMAMMFKKCSSAVTPLQELPNGGGCDKNLLAALSRVLSKAMETDIENRFKSAKEMGIALEMAATGEVAGLPKTRARRIPKKKIALVTISTALLLAGSFVGLRMFKFFAKQQNELAHFADYCKRDAPIVARALFNDRSVASRELALHGIFNTAKIHGMSEEVSAPSDNVQVSQILLSSLDSHSLQPVSLVVSKNKHFYMVRFLYGLRTSPGGNDPDNMVPTISEVSISKDDSLAH